MASIFSPQKYRIEDRIGIPFIDEHEIASILAENQNPSLQRIEEIIDRSLAKQRLSLSDVAALLAVEDPFMVGRIKEAAKQLKKQIYGNRIVLFAPLYIGNKCANNCLYCGFRSSNTETIRQTLTDNQIVKETEALLESGHKRLVLVYGEHDTYDAKYIAQTVKTVYCAKKRGASIRRVNINAAPFDIEGFKIIHSSGIGTYQIFQETYDRNTYRQFHQGGRKSDYDYRLMAFDRAMQAGIDDVGLGILVGLGHWKKEVLALIRHVNHLEACFNIGPHTLSFPRIKEAQGVDSSLFKEVSDQDFVRMIAILRLAVPYAGMILTARESEAVRLEAMCYGISQIDGGTKIDIGGYANDNDTQKQKKEQFTINDERTLSQVIENLIDGRYIPSFCTSCYRKGRTGQHFMEFSVPGFIKQYCTPNALFTLAEFLEDYADQSLKEKGYQFLEEELMKMTSEQHKNIRLRLEKIKNNQRDEYI